MQTPPSSSGPLTHSLTFVNNSRKLRSSGQVVQYTQRAQVEIDLSPTDQTGLVTQRPRPNPSPTHIHTPIYHFSLDMHFAMSRTLLLSPRVTIQQHTSHLCPTTVTPCHVSRYLVLSHLQKLPSARRCSPHFTNNSINAAAAAVAFLPPYLGSSIDALRAAAAARSLLVAFSLMSISLSVFLGGRCFGLSWCRRHMRLLYRNCAYISEEEAHSSSFTLLGCMDM